VLGTGEEPAVVVPAGGRAGVFVLRPAADDGLAVVDVEVEDAAKTTDNVGSGEAIELHGKRVPRCCKAVTERERTKGGLRDKTFEVDGDAVVGDCVKEADGDAGCGGNEGFGAGLLVAEGGAEDVGGIEGYAGVDDFSGGGADGDFEDGAEDTGECGGVKGGGGYEGVDEDSGYELGPAGAGRDSDPGRNRGYAEVGDGACTGDVGIGPGGNPGLRRLREGEIAVEPEVAGGDVATDGDGRAGGYGDWRETEGAVVKRSGAAARDEERDGDDGDRSVGGATGRVNGDLDPEGPGGGRELPDVGSQED
jgi:hypothetical protein